MRAGSGRTGPPVVVPEDAGTGGRLVAGAPAGGAPLAGDPPRGGAAGGCGSGKGGRAAPCAFVCAAASPTAYADATGAHAASHGTVEAIKAKPATRTRPQPSATTVARVRRNRCNRRNRHHCGNTRNTRTEHNERTG